MYLLCIQKVQQCIFTAEYAVPFPQVTKALDTGGTHSYQRKDHACCAHVLGG